MNTNNGVKWKIFILPKKLCACDLLAMLSFIVQQMTELAKMK